MTLSKKGWIVLGLGALIGFIGLISWVKAQTGQNVYLPFITCNSCPSATPTTMPISGTVAMKAEVWADNWFAFYLGNTLVKEDSVPITTERSFNQETFNFTASYPMQFNFIAKDFKENDTGLEYIGKPNQQMGDAGLIAQFTNTATGQVMAVTNSDWKCTVIHDAPLDKSCESQANPVAGVAPCTFTSLSEPDGWKNLTFNDSAWNKATLYTAAQVGPKDGYNEISWNTNAQFIWGPDLETNNTILCRLTITAP